MYYQSHKADIGIFHNYSEQPQSDAYDQYDDSGDVLKRHQNPAGDVERRANQRIKLKMIQSHPKLEMLKFRNQVLTVQLKGLIVDEFARQLTPPHLHIAVTAFGKKSLIKLSINNYLKIELEMRDSYLCILSNVLKI